ncbi:MAG: hypothetical protein J6M18_05795 [Actinomycetaceae bacterium]|nr:hypothetical protein [Actinomycetaceae bacterium]
MKKKFLEYTTVVLIWIQAIIFSLAVSFFLNASLHDGVKQYAQSNRQEIRISGVSAEKEHDVWEAIFSQVYENDLFIIRTKTDEDIFRYQTIVAIEGKIQNVHNTYDFLGTTIFTPEDFDMLQKSEVEKATLGNTFGGFTSIKELDHFDALGDIQIQRMSDFSSESTVNGIYYVDGFTVENYDSFLNSIAQASGMDRSDIAKKTSGEEVDNLLMAYVFIAIGVTSFLIIILASLILIKKVPTLGKMMLLGWSRSQFIFSVYRTLVYGFVISAILQILSGILIGASFISVLYISYYLLSSVVQGILLICILGFPAFVVFSISPINAIKKRLPRKLFVGILIGLFSFSGIGVIGIAHISDEPIRLISEKYALLNQWESVKDYYVLDSYVPGDDVASEAGSLPTMEKDVYSWYSKYYNEKGVYLFTSTFNSKKYWEDLKKEEVYDFELPTKERWFFVMSPNYAQKINVPLSDEILQKVQNGERIYLISSSIDSAEKELLKNYCKFLDLDSSEGRSGITTKFMKDRQVSFVDYDFTEKIFTWGVQEEGEESYTVDPVILISTPANMTSLEGESLIASMVNDNYIKLDRQALENFTSVDVLKSFHLYDNHIHFSTINSKVADVIKDMKYVIYLVGFLVILGIIFSLTLLYISFALYDHLFRERIVVGTFLGHGTWRVYRLLFLAMVCVGLTQAMLVTWYGSLIVSMYWLFFLVCEVLLLFVVMRKNVSSIPAFLKMGES